MTKTSSAKGMELPEVAGTYYRGMQRKSDPMLKSKLPSVTFSSLEVAKQYAGDNGVVYEAYIEGYKPFVNTPRDAFVDFDTIKARVGVREAKKFFGRHPASVISTDAWSDMLKELGRDPHQGKGVQYKLLSDLLKTNSGLLSRLCIQIWHLLDDRYVINVLTEKGYDCAVYRGSGVSWDTHEVRIWSSNNATELRKIAEETVEA